MNIIRVSMRNTEDRQAVQCTDIHAYLDPNIYYIAIILDEIVNLA